jgi:hypothetical protein
MAQHTSDESVLGKIETLVHEEQHLCTGSGYVRLFLVTGLARRQRL